MTAAASTPNAIQPPISMAWPPSRLLPTITYAREPPPQSPARRAGSPHGQKLVIKRQRLAENRPGHLADLRRRQRCRRARAAARGAAAPERQRRRFLADVRQLGGR